MPAQPAAAIQGLITNDVTRMQQEHVPVLYAAMLNNKGRQLYDMLLHRDSFDNTAVLLDCPAEAAANLKKLLHRYKLRSHVTVDDASDDFSVVCAWKSSTPSPHDTGARLFKKTLCSSTLPMTSTPDWKTPWQPSASASICTNLVG